MVQFVDLRCEALVLLTSIVKRFGAMVMKDANVKAIANAIAKLLAHLLNLITTQILASLLA